MSETKKKFSVPTEELEKQNDFNEQVRSVLDSKFAIKSPKAYVHTYGCMGNVADGEVIKGMLNKMGYEMTEVLTEADLVLYNTCAIREHAEDRVFGNVGELKKYKKENPELIIALCGCMMQQERIAEKLNKSYPYVDLVFGTHVIYKLPEFIFRVLSYGKRVYDITESDGNIVEGLPLLRDKSFKASVPIVYGCNNFCTYCIVPYVKGRERSRDFDVIVNEVKELIKAGYKEITLLGQNVNSYNKTLDESKRFPALLKTLNDLDGEFIIRFMTSHPRDCSKQLIEVMANGDKIAKHLHLPFQSGNDEVLKIMNRHYNRESYLELIDYAYKLMPDLSITSDVIVGFPGETYEQFKDTLSLVEKVRYSTLFTFIFSAREGTKAFSMPDPVSRKEKGKWFKELTDLQEKIAGEKNSACKDKIYRVLVDSYCTDTNKLTGKTEGSINIAFEGDESLVGSFVNVKATNPRTWVINGEICD